tara:strand:+ start:334 stop:468 length:135 start_codon:yes stop_codon:yes gene_type:complete
MDDEINDNEIIIDEMKWETTNGYTWDDNKSLWDIFTDQEKKSPK